MAFVDATAVQVALPADRPGAGRVAVRAAVDDLRLHPGAGVADPARRLARRPVRPPPGLPGRGRLVRRGLAGLRPGPDHRSAGGRPGPAGRRRRAADPGSLALIQSSFRPGDRAKAIGLWSALAGIAGLIGPFLGGVLVDAVSWRLVFLLNVPVAVLILAVAGRHVPESRDPAEHGRFDYLGAALGALALGGVTYALIGAGENMRRSDVVASAAVGLAAGVAFVVHERARPTRCCRWDCSPTGSSPAPTWPPSPSTGRSAAAGSSSSSSCRRSSATTPRLRGRGDAAVDPAAHPALAHRRRAGDADRPAAADDRRPAPGRGRDAVAGRGRRRRPLRDRGPPRLAAPGPRDGRGRDPADGDRAGRRPGRARRDRQRRQQRDGPGRPAAGGRGAARSRSVSPATTTRTRSRSPPATGRRWWCAPWRSPSAARSPG